MCVLFCLYLVVDEAVAVVVVVANLFVVDGAARLGKEFALVLCLQFVLFSLDCLLLARFLDAHTLALSI